ncbi:MAG TPA: C1 family peptidase [Iamia sp.]
MSTTPLDYAELGLDDDHQRVLAKMGVTSIEDAVGLLGAEPAFTEQPEGLALLRRSEAVLERGDVALAYAPGPPPDVGHGLALPEGFRPEPVSQALILADPPNARPGPPDPPLAGSDFSLVVDLRDRSRPVRSQGTRPTCVGHACAAAAEMFFDGLDLSPNFIFANAKARDQRPQVRGTWVHHAAESLEHEGACLEECWPYDATDIPGDLTHGSAPGEAIADGLTRLSRPHVFRDLTTAPDPDDLHRDWVMEALDEGHPVVVGVLTFPSWDSREVWASGKLLLPPVGSESDTGHAMCIVGYGYSPSQYPADPEFFLVKNSWGERFAEASPIAKGHAIMPADYIDKFAMEAAVITYDQPP